MSHFVALPCVRAQKAAPNVLMEWNSFINNLIVKKLLISRWIHLFKFTSLKQNIQVYVWVSKRTPPKPKEEDIVDFYSTSFLPLFLFNSSSYSLRSCLFFVCFFVSILFVLTLTIECQHSNTRYSYHSFYSFSLVLDPIQTTDHFQLLECQYRRKITYTQ